MLRATNVVRLDRSLAPRLDVRTVVVSDLHLGTTESKVDAAIEFLTQVRCDKLILNGDIVDTWSLRRRPAWNGNHTRFMRLVCEWFQLGGTQVVYTRGNHDEVPSTVLPAGVPCPDLVTDHVHEGVRGRYLVLHGDRFDPVVRHGRGIALLGDIGYHLLLRLNRPYNRLRNLCGRDYRSLSQPVKTRVKRAVCRVSGHDRRIRRLARERGCVGVICGHTHLPANRRIGDVHYLNAGDWVESMTAVIEHHDGTWEWVCAATALDA